MNRGSSSADSAYLMQLQQQHRRGRSLSTSMVKEKDDDLALFHEMRKREKERNTLLLLPNSDEFEPPLATVKSSSSPIYRITPSTPLPKSRADDLLNADGDKNDYDWLLTPPGTPLFTSLEMEIPAIPMDHRGTPVLRPPPTLKSSRLMNPGMEPTSKVVRSNIPSRQTTTSSLSNNSINTVSKRPSMSTGTGHVSSRPSTPTSRSVIPASMSAAPASRPAAPASRPAAPASRPAAPASRPAAPASRPAAPASRSSLTASRPSTPTSRPTISASRTSVTTSRPSTPTARSTIPATRPSSRPSTPTRRPSTPNLSQSSSVPPARSSSVGKSASMPSRNSAPSRGSSPTVKSQPWQPAAIPGFSLDAPPNLRTTMPERPPSATRGRPGAPSAARSANEAPISAARSANEAPIASSRPRRQSCSPSVTRGRISNDSQNSDRSSIQSSKSHSIGNNVAVPGVLGSKMVEKVLNARRAAPKQQEDQLSVRSISSTMQAKRPVKPVLSPDSTGFGRTLSKKSLDMALRHMDIRRSTPSSLRPLMTNIPTSSLYSVRSGAPRSRATSISDSPVATSSNASSEHSASIALGPEGSELDDDDFGSERGSRTSPTSQQGSILSKGDLGSTNWLHSPEFRDDKYDQAFLYNRGFEQLLDPLEGPVSATNVGADCESKIRLEY